MSSLPHLGQDRWSGVVDPPRPALDLSRPARSRRLRVRVLTALLLLAVVVSAVVWWRSPAVVTPEGYLPSAPGASAVTLSVLTGSGDVLVDASARETPDQVAVVVKIRSPRGARVLVQIPLEVTVPLERPLGARSVVDGRTGAVLPPVERHR